MSDFYVGLGTAVAERTILRKKGPAWETWDDVCDRVAHGNASLCKTPLEQVSEFGVINKLMKKKVMITSGRHLEHGDLIQKYKPMEVYTNCATSFSTFNLLYLLLNGSGVGRSYDDDLMLVNWDHMPTVVCVLSDSHADYNYVHHTTPREAAHKYDNAIWVKCKDSREGWSEVVETLEIMAFEKIHRDKIVVIDFSDVRPSNAPIAGMGGKPASGPLPLMSAIDKISTVKGMAPWKQSLYIDHYLAECVRVGGVRRSARMSTKYWKDTTILEFIEVKRPVEFRGKTMAEIIALRKTSTPMGFLWSSNNSVMVDKEFWELLNLKPRNPRYKSPIARHAREVFKRVTECSYGDGTGEPGLINVDLLESTDVPDNVTFGNERHSPADTTLLFLDQLMRVVRKKLYKYIVNPYKNMRPFKVT